MNLSLHVHLMSWILTGISNSISAAVTCFGQAREREREMSIDTVSHVHQRTLPGKSKGPSKASRGSSGSLSLVIDVASLFSCSMLVVELCNHQSSHQYLPGRGRRKATSQSEGESSWPCQGRGALRSLDRFGWFVLHQTI